MLNFLSGLLLFLKFPKIEVNKFSRYCKKLFGFLYALVRVRARVCVYVLTDSLCDPSQRCEFKV